MHVHFAVNLNRSYLEEGVWGIIGDKFTQIWTVPHCLIDCGQGGCGTWEAIEKRASRWWKMEVGMIPQIRGFRK